MVALLLKLFTTLLGEQVSVFKIGFSVSFMQRGIKVNKES